MQWRTGNLIERATLLNNITNMLCHIACYFRFYYAFLPGVYLFELFLWSCVYRSPSWRNGSWNGPTARWNGPRTRGYGSRRRRWSFSKCQPDEEAGARSQISYQSGAKPKSNGTSQAPPSPHGRLHETQNTRSINGPAPAATPSARWAASHGRVRGRTVASPDGPTGHVAPQASPSYAAQHVFTAATESWRWWRISAADARPWSHATSQYAAAAIQHGRRRRSAPLPRSKRSLGYGNAGPSSGNARECRSQPAP